MMRIVSNRRSNDAAIKDLRRRLDAFYASTETYLAFEPGAGDPASPYMDELEPMLHELLRHPAPRAEADRRVRVLELGAGRPVFPDRFAPLRGDIAYHVQDVTPSNESYLDSVADAVFIGDVAEIHGEYDLVFSTFVFEHVTAPIELLEKVQRLLRPGGFHVIFCPRYDLPGYLCPSLRHLRGLERLNVLASLPWASLTARLAGRPQFRINCDPALFHRPWFRDADAVHLVTRWEVERWHRANAFDVRRLYPRTSGWRDFLAKRWLQLCLACRKRAGDIGEVTA